MQVSKGQIILGSLVVTIFGCVMVLYVLTPETLPHNNNEWSMLIGALISQFTLVLGWFFGSSKGSSDKNAIINKLKGFNE